MVDGLQLSELEKMLEVRRLEEATCKLHPLDIYSKFNNYSTEQVCQVPPQFIEWSKDSDYSKTGYFVDGDREKRLYGYFRSQDEFEKSVEKTPYGYRDFDPSIDGKEFPFDPSGYSIVKVASRQISSSFLKECVIALAGKIGEDGVFRIDIYINKTARLSMLARNLDTICYKIHDIKLGLSNLEVQSWNLMEEIKKTLIS